MKKILKALAILASFSVLTRMLGFFFRIFLSRLIGPEELGIYQISFSVFMVLETFISSGLPLIVSKETAVFNAKKDKKSEYGVVTSALIIGVITSLIICLIIFVFKNVLNNIFTDSRCITILFILLPTLIFSSVYSSLRGNLWGHKKYFLVSFSEFIEQVIRTIFTVLFLGVISFSLEKVFLASISYVISCVLTSFIVLFIYMKSGKRFANPKKYFKPVLKSSIPITLVRVVSSLLMPLISIIIPIKLMSIGYTSSQALAVFGIAMGMTFPLLYVPSTLIGALSMTIIPDLSSAVFAQDYSEIKSRINFAIKFSIFISFLFIPLYFALGSPIGMFFYANSQSGYFLSRSSILILPICLSGVTTSCLNALNMEVKGFINYIIGAVLLILSILFLTNVFGVLSLVWGMGLCLGGASVLNIIMLNRKLNENFFNFKYLFLSILASFSSLLMSKWIFNILSNFISLFFNLAISCIVGSVFYLAFCLVLGLYNYSFFELTNLLKEKVKKIKNKKQKNIQN